MISAKRGEASETGRCRGQVEGKEKRVSRGDDGRTGGVHRTDARSTRRGDRASSSSVAIARAHLLRTARSSRRSPPRGLRSRGPSARPSRGSRTGGVLLFSSGRNRTLRDEIREPTRARAGRDDVDVHDATARGYRIAPRRRRRARTTRTKRNERARTSGRGRARWHCGRACRHAGELANGFQSQSVENDRSLGVALNRHYRALVALRRRHIATPTRSFARWGSSSRPARTHRRRRPRSS